MFTQTILVLSALLTFTGIAKAADPVEATKSVQVTTTFRAELDEKTWLEFTPQLKNPKAWTVTRIRACESYPCSNESMKSRAGVVYPRLVSNYEDAPLRIRLDDKLILVKQNLAWGRPTTGPQTEYMLEMDVNGEIKKFPVYRHDGFVFGQ